MFHGTYFLNIKSGSLKSKIINGKLKTFVLSCTFYFINRDEIDDSYGATVTILQACPLSSTTPHLRNEGQLMRE